MKVTPTPTPRPTAAKISDPEPGPATSLSASDDTGTALTVSWHAPKVAIKPSYKVLWRLKGENDWTNSSKSTTETEMRITGLKPETAYEFVVDTTNGD